MFFGANASQDNGDTHLNYIRELDYISAKYKARSTVERGSEGAEEASLDTRGTPAKRTNGYTVVSASQPSQSASMAINEDGTDYSYFSTVNFGSSGVSLNMLVDTGAANTWVMGSDCKSKACLAHNTFGRANSGTLQVTNTPWNVTYGTGQVGGVVVNDTISMAGFTLPLAFGSASVTSNDFMTYPMDGILGLGRPKSNVMGVPTVMEALDSAHLLKAKLLGVNLQRNVDGATDGEVNFGTVDSSKFTGDLSYTTSVSNDGLWEVPVDDAGVDNQGLKFTGKTAIIDTGTSFVLMPPDDAKKLLTQIPKAEPSGETFHIPCATTAAIQFTFSGVTYNVSTKDYLGKSIDGGSMCASNIIGRQTFGANQWLMGDAFLKNVYTVFDFTQNRIGEISRHDPSISSERLTTFKVSASKVLQNLAKVLLLVAALVRAFPLLPHRPNHPRQHRPRRIARSLLHPPALCSLDLLELLLTHPHLQGLRQPLQPPTPPLGHRGLLPKRPAQPLQEALQPHCPTQSRPARKSTFRQAQCLFLSPYYLSYTAYNHGIYGDKKRIIGIGSPSFLASAVCSAFVASCALSGHARCIGFN